jgi:hypothetical protein
MRMYVCKNFIYPTYQIRFVPQTLSQMEIFVFDLCRSFLPRLPSLFFHSSEYGSLKGVKELPMPKHRFSGGHRYLIRVRGTQKYRPSHVASTALIFLFIRVNKIGLQKNPAGTTKLPR